MKQKYNIGERVVVKIAKGITDTGTIVNFGSGAYIIRFSWNRSAYVWPKNVIGRADDPKCRCKCNCNN